MPRTVTKKVGELELKTRKRKSKRTFADGQVDIVEEIQNEPGVQDLMLKRPKSKKKLLRSNTGSKLQV